MKQKPETLQHQRAAVASNECKWVSKERKFAEKPSSRHSLECLEAYKDPNIFGIVLSRTLARRDPQKAQQLDFPPHIQISLFVCRFYLLNRFTSDVRFCRFAARARVKGFLFFDFTALALFRVKVHLSFFVFTDLRFYPVCALRDPVTDPTTQNQHFRQAFAGCACSPPAL